MTSIVISGSGLYTPPFAVSNEALVAAFNEPYQADDLSDYALPVHGEARGTEYAMIEIRNDLIATPEGQADWAGRIARALRPALPLS